MEIQVPKKTALDHLTLFTAQGTHWYHLGSFKTHLEQNRVLNQRQWSSLDVGLGEPQYLEWLWGTGKVLKSRPAAHSPVPLSPVCSLLSPQAIQILIGLFHIASAANPQLYQTATLLGLSGYLVWGGLSVSTRPCGLLSRSSEGTQGKGMERPLDPTPSHITLTASKSAGTAEAEEPAYTLAIPTPTSQEVWAANIYCHIITRVFRIGAWAM